MAPVKTRRENSTLQVRVESRSGPSPGVDCPQGINTNGSLSAWNIHRMFHKIFEMPCAEWYTRVDSRLLNGSRRPSWPSTPGLVADCQVAYHSPPTGSQPPPQ
eukprot:2927634-Pyramimonas_sp.AAC.1